MILTASNLDKECGKLGIEVLAAPKSGHRTSFKGVQTITEFMHFW